MQRLNDAEFARDRAEKQLLVLQEQYKAAISNLGNTNQQLQLLGKERDYYKQNDAIQKNQLETLEKTIDLNLEKISNLNTTIRGLEGELAQTHNQYAVAILEKSGSEEDKRSEEYALLYSAAQKEQERLKKQIQHLENLIKTEKVLILNQ